jgi:hypothetical protein
VAGFEPACTALSASAFVELFMASCWCGEEAALGSAPSLVAAASFAPVFVD